MTKEEYLALISNRAVDERKVKAVAEVYQGELPDVILKIVSSAEETVFVDEARILAFEEILLAQQELHVDFNARHIIPVADRGDNDFAVYHLEEKQWYLFNIIDKTLFNKRNSFQDLI